MIKVASGSSSALLPLMQLLQLNIYFQCKYRCWQVQGIHGAICTQKCQDLHVCCAFPVVTGSIAAALQHTAAVLGSRSNTTTDILQSNFCQELRDLIKTTLAEVNACIECAQETVVAEAVQNEQASQQLIMIHYARNVFCCLSVPYNAYLSHIHTAPAGHVNTTKHAVCTCSAGQGSHWNADLPQMSNAGGAVVSKAG